MSPASLRRAIENMGRSLAELDRVERRQWNEVDPPASADEVPTVPFRRVTLPEKR